MAPDGNPALKLRAEDADDLAVLSACLQDALVAVRDLGLSARRAAVSSSSPIAFAGRAGCARCRAKRVIERVLCAVTFGAVAGVSYRGFRRSDEDRILCLLAIRSEPDGTGGASIHLEFAGAAAIRLDAGRILVPRQGFRRAVADPLAPAP